MTDRQRQMIEAYIPSPPDPELEFGEYYMKDSAERVIRVRVVSVAYSMDDRDICEVRTVGAKQHAVLNAFGEYGRYPGWYYRYALYDNRQDCRDDTHYIYDAWEDLRELQEKEGKKDAGT